MNKLMLIPLAASALVGGCATTYDDSPYGYYDRGYYSRYGNYDWNHPDPTYNGYYADRYYREDHRYREYRLGADDRIYRGNDGRYYCKRNDGTTGLVVGAVAGGVLGNVIDGGHSRSVGTILGAILGGAAGRSIDNNNSEVHCR